MAQTEMVGTTQGAVKKDGRKYNFKVKGPDLKWKPVGTGFMRADPSGGVATLFREDGSKLENVAIFPNDGKHAGATATSAQPAAGEPTQGAAVKKDGRAYNMKIKGPDQKWKLVGTLFIRTDGAQGAATLFNFNADGSTLENVVVFLNDGKYGGARKS